MAYQRANDIGGSSSNSVSPLPLGLASRARQIASTNMTQRRTTSGSGSDSFRQNTTSKSTTGGSRLGGKMPHSAIGTRASKPINATPMAPNAAPISATYQTNATPIARSYSGGSGKSAPQIGKGAPVNNQSRARRSNGRVSASPSRGQSFGMAGASASEGRAAKKTIRRPLKGG